VRLQPPTEFTCRRVVTSHVNQDDLRNEGTSCGKSVRIGSVVSDTVASITETPERKRWGR
jgi:hypothetical protein